MLISKHNHPMRHWRKNGGGLEYRGQRGTEGTEGTPPPKKKMVIGDRRGVTRLTSLTSLTGRPGQPCQPCQPRQPCPIPSQSCQSGQSRPKPAGRNSKPDKLSRRHGGMGMDKIPITLYFSTTAGGCTRPCESTPVDWHRKNILHPSRGS